MIDMEFVPELPDFPGAEAGAFAAAGPLVIWPPPNHKGSHLNGERLISEFGSMPGIFFILSRTGSMVAFMFVAFANSLGVIRSAHIALGRI